MKNEAEAYMLKELSSLKWQEKATKLACDDTESKIVEMQEKVSALEENLKSERHFPLSFHIVAMSLIGISFKC